MELTEMLANTAEAITSATKVKETMFPASLDSFILDSSKNVYVEESVSKLLSSLVSSGSSEKLSKVMATAAKIADSLGVESLEGYNKYDIASVCDEAATEISFSYKVAAGEIDVEEYTDRLVDHAASRLIVFTDDFIENKLPLTVDLLCGQLVRVYPPAAAMVPIVKNLVPILQPKIKQCVRTGINAVAKHAKAILPKLFNTAKVKVQQFAAKTLNFA